MLECDIYLVSEVERLKADYSELWDRYREVVHENTEMNRRLDSYRRRAAMEGDEWMNL